MWNKPKAFVSNACTLFHTAFDFLKPRNSPCLPQRWPIVSVCLNLAKNYKLAKKGRSALQAAWMVGSLEAAQKSVYKLTFLAMQSSPGATLDKHCHMVVQLSEAQPMSPVSYVSPPLPQAASDSKTHPSPGNSRSPLFHMCQC